MKSISVLILATILGLSSSAGATQKARAAVMRFLKKEGSPTQGLRVVTTKRFAKGTEQVSLLKQGSKERLLSVSPKGAVLERGVKRGRWMNYPKYGTYNPDIPNGSRMEYVTGKKLKTIEDAEGDYFKHERYSEHPGATGTARASDF